MSDSFSKFKVKVSKIKDYNKFCNECWNALSDAMYKLRTCEKSDKFYDRINEADKFLSFTKEHLIHWKWQTKVFWECADEELLSFRCNPWLRNGTLEKAIKNSLH